jgi:hypothetical protein
VIEEIKEILPEDIELGASIGDLDFKPGTASLAALGAAVCRVDYITASMYAVKTPGEVGAMTKAISKATMDHGSRLIISGYADWSRIGCASPFEFVGEIPEADVIMVDTAIKDGKNLFDFVTVEMLQGLNDAAHEQGLKTCFAGSIRLQHLPLALEANPDILGFRGVVCEKGEAKREKVAALMDELMKLGALRCIR